MSSRTERIGRLGPRDHDRAAAGMTYVYPVVSRRAGGVSVGINLNPNNACNWRCVYCQVPGLSSGKGPRIDLGLLERELDELLLHVTRGDFFERSVPPEVRRLSDVAFSGNGEPTSSPDFADAIDVVSRALARHDLAGKIPLVLITNGSLTHKPAVQSALRRLSELRGEVWFKLDSATARGSVAINGQRVPPAEHLKKLAAAARLCPTWVQSCFFLWNGAEPSKQERSSYLGALGALVAEGVPLRGVQLYTLARPSLQPEAAALESVPRAWLDALAAEIRALGLTVSVSV
jgi:pyruvate-formate lyase-activating enzyme